MTELDSGPQPTNGMAIASLVLGIVSVLIVWIPFVGLFGTLLAIIGLVLGVLALKGISGKGLAIGGIVTSGISLVITLLYLLVFGAVIGAAATANAAG